MKKEDQHLPDSSQSTLIENIIISLKPWTVVQLGDKFKEAVKNGLDHNLKGKTFLNPDENTPSDIDILLVSDPDRWSDVNKADTVISTSPNGKPAHVKTPHGIYIWRKDTTE
jgi:hypothetical protein